MISLKKAYKIAEKHMPKCYIVGISEIGAGWLFEFSHEKGGEPFDESPLLVNRKNGETSSFFLPDHSDEPVEIDMNLV